MCIIDKILFKILFDRKHGFLWGIISISTTVFVLCPSWKLPASPSWTPQVSSSWTFCCLEELRSKTFLVAFGSKRTVADLFSDRKGCGLESRSYFHPGRNGCLEKMASSSESRILSTNTPLPLTSPWPFSQNRVQIGKVPAAKSPRSPLATSGLGSAD